MAHCIVGEGDGCRVPVGFFRGFPQFCQRSVIGVERIERCFGIAARDWVPNISQSGETAQRPPTFTADPYFRTAGLDRLRLKEDILELHVIAFKGGVFLRPERLERPNIFVRNRPPVP